MPARIHVLDDQTINQIAAGEVIENSASVVKELVENSLDADASEIVVEVKGGGRQSIRVTDNGAGMLSDDALLCLERHATSKIRQLGDIDQLHTMGFRGEAIPSIASISRMTLLTRPNEQDKGTIIVVDGGKILKHSPTDCSQGTTIEVKGLFFNVPARKKFQRSPSHDNMAIERIMEVLALGNPEVKFQLIINQKTVLNTPAPVDGKTRLSDVLGKGFATAMRPLDIQEGPYRVEGFIGVPTFNRHNRSGQYLFINKRPVACPGLSIAVRDAYGTRLPPKRFPVFVLHLKIPGGEVDVNVHPQKKEVRLRQLSGMKDLLTKGVNQALRHGGMRQISPEIPSHAQTGVSYKDLLDEPAEGAPEKLSWDTPLPTVEEATLEFDYISQREQRTQVLATVSNFILLNGPESSPTILGDHPPNCLMLVDQRLAHSRILFEQMLKRHHEKMENGELQTLLVPLTLELTREDSETIRHNLGAFRNMGVSLKEFGPNCYVIEAVADNLRASECKDLVLQAVNDLKQMNPHGEKVQDKFRSLALAASRSAIPRNYRLSLPEAHAIVDRLLKCDSPTICPEGRPIILHMNLDQLAKQLEKVDACRT